MTIQSKVRGLKSGQSSNGAPLTPEARQCRSRSRSLKATSSPRPVETKTDEGLGLVETIYIELTRDIGHRINGSAHVMFLLHPGRDPQVQPENHVGL